VTTKLTIEPDHNIARGEGVEVYVAGPSVFIDPRFHRQGHGSTAMDATQGFAHNRLGATWQRAMIDPSNEISQRMAQARCMECVLPAKPIYGFTQQTWEGPLSPPG
jgi:GNAT superfamily N-acetyltransferase